MKEIKEIESIHQIPEDFDFLLINDSQPISMYLDEWMDLVLLIELKSFEQELNDEQKVIIDSLKDDINTAVVQAYNRYASLCKYAKEMIDRGLCPDHSQTR